MTHLILNKIEDLLGGRRSLSGHLHDPLAPIVVKNSRNKQAVFGKALITRNFERTGGASAAKFDLGR